MWCWGCDVRRAAGNLLLAYGAKKRPSPDPHFHSAYSFQATTEGVLNLWGWGLWMACTHCGSLLISRSRFRVGYTPDVILTPDAWQQRNLPPTAGIQNAGDTVHVYHLLTLALNWIGAYESWLLDQVEADYREHVIAQWPQRRHHKGGVPATEMAERWFQLAAKTRQPTMD